MSQYTTFINGQEYGFYYLSPELDEPIAAGQVRKALPWPESPNLPLVYRKRPTVNNPAPGPVPDTKGDCYKLHEHGFDLASTPMAWRQEAVQFFQRPDVSLVSTLNTQAINWYKNYRIDKDRLRGVVEDARIVCTGVYIKDFDCFIDHIKYDSIRQYGVFIAKYYFPDGIPSIDKFGSPVSLNIPRSPDGYYYVTEEGQLCFLSRPVSDDPDDPIDPPPPPNDDPIDPDIPIVGAGQTHALIADTFSEVEQCEFPLWTSNSVFNLDEKFTDATDSNPAIDYCLDVYDKDPATDHCAQLQMKLIYADYEGKGAIDLGGFDDETLTKAMYTQYANILLPQSQNKFIINDIEQDGVYIIDVQRHLYKDSLDPGNIELTFGTIADSSATPDVTLLANITYDGTNQDTYVDTNVGNQDKVDLKQPYSLVSGNLEQGAQGSEEVGILYPSHGMIVLSRTALEGGGNDMVREIQTSCKNPYRLYQAMVTKSMAVTNNYTDASGDYFGFKARGIECKQVKYAFVRVKNFQFNFSNNPTYTQDVDGTILDDMQSDSKTYITSVGLYNSNKELLAVGKLSRPILKSICEEAVITVKIEQ